MEKRTDNLPDVEALRHANTLLNALGLTELFPCVWISENGDGAIVVSPKGLIAVVSSHELALRYAASLWAYYCRPNQRFDEPNWPALSKPWLTPNLEDPTWLRLRRWLSRLARR